MDRPQIDLNRLEDNKCARCGINLGRIVNRGAPCRSCKFRVCKSCREFITTTTTTTRAITVEGSQVINTTKSTTTLSSSIYSTNTFGATNDWICIVCYKRKQMWVLSKAQLSLAIECWAQCAFNRIFSTVSVLTYVCV